MKNEEIIAGEEDAGKRLDLFLVEKLPGGHSRSQIKKKIDEGLVTLEGKPTKAHHPVRAGEVIHVLWTDTVSEDTVSQDIPLDILYEDDDILLLNKPPGLVVHPAAGNPDGTLVNALLFHTQKLSQSGGSSRPGIVHRLDKGTSGIMIVAKNDCAHAFLSQQFRDHSLQRIYHVAVNGVVQHEQGICEAAVGRAFLSRKKMVIRPAGGRDAVTHYRVLERFREATLLELRLETGRTHQIRVHMRHLGHPVLGDALYGVSTPLLDRPAVHALALGFLHPKTKKEMRFECSLPADMIHLVEQLRDGTPIQPRLRQLDL